MQLLLLAGSCRRVELLPTVFTSVAIASIPITNIRPFLAHGNFRDLSILPSVLRALYCSHAHKVFDQCPGPLVHAVIGCLVIGAFRHGFPHR
jgi:hypothetical protein